MSELPKPGVSGVCPHCGRDVVFAYPTLCEGRDEYERKLDYQYSTPDGTFQLIGSKCPNRDCRKFVLIRQHLVFEPEQHWEDDLLVWPRGVTRTIPKGFSPEIERDFKEACGTLYVSKRASAALSRRCLQNLLKEKEDVHKKNPLRRN